MSETRTEAGEVPKVLALHPEGAKGGWLWREWRSGAVRFGWFNAETGEDFPLGYPGKIPAGFQLFAAFPDGRMTISGDWPPEMEDDAAALARELADDLPDWLKSGSEWEREMARRVMELLPATMTEAEQNCLLAGFLYRGMNDGPALAEAHAKAGAFNHAVNPYLDAVKKARAEHGDRSAKQLFEAAGGREEVCCGAVIWRSADGREVDRAEWDRAVSKVKEAAAKAAKAEK